MIKSITLLKKNSSKYYYIYNYYYYLSLWYINIGILFIIMIYNNKYLQLYKL